MPKLLLESLQKQEEGKDIPMIRNNVYATMDKDLYFNKGIKLKCHANSIQVKLFVLYLIHLKH